MASENNVNGKRNEDNPEFSSFQQLLKQVLSVPKEDVDRQRAEEKREKERKQAS